MALTAPTAPAGEPPRLYQEVAEAAEVPAQLLYALAAAESGAALSSGRYEPWPWTLNVGGEPERYPSREAAQAALRQHRADGRRNIDVGLMQVNWHWHGERFASLSQALEPQANLQMGAAILRGRYEERGDWLEAAGAYHAPSDPQAAAAHREAVAEHLPAPVGERAGSRSREGGLSCP
ncbi:transglycosylase SLT domain-containing protein [Halorhodospira sp. 9622]|uniref:transglycosylase SLT domain-containing protein n=1 Tax=Halorhodospira sp. 9622 TaxID=2899136 RepID=UPI001EE94DD7|nr:transglycosylase SLT domain-containing protein [Halorhodospira sp. 9622]MCG5537360.1 transglycosylase SLT domain-containing protein [Halorhodospira sp. 9622]